jgi:GTP-sensing pleiotropic transcriptional regulator CodY
MMMMMKKKKKKKTRLITIIMKKKKSKKNKNKNKPVKDLARSHEDVVSSNLLAMQEARKLQCH